MYVNDKRLITEIGYLVTGLFLVISNWGEGGIDTYLGGVNMCKAQIDIK